ncbi:competence protein ComEC [Marinobacter gudaonensis]|uniref:Competence protein ComEC n=1 Tax=Marinobacter gudaonensis TaxID=375760 RepID=A0A1I6GEY9_9GAMM|nr:DNA internalization-related competence protein ComEC/Rec2 [Marinobacter gudaonensis]SFR40647.1 competence protein ComEC [Marinobacter gudaonensis]
MSGTINRPPGVEGAGGLAVLGVITFSFGVILLYWLSILPPPEYVLATIVALGLLALLWPSATARRFAVAALGVLLGLGWASWHARDRLSEVLPSVLEGEAVEVSGYLCDIPSSGSFRSLRFSFCVTEWHGLPRRFESRVSSGQLPALLRLAWYGHAGERLPGHKLRLKVVLKRPHGNLNPAGFRYEDWLFRKGYRATGSVRDAQSNPSVVCSLNCRYRKVHLELNEWVEGRFGGARQFPLIASLLTGHRGHLTDNHWDTLKATGTIHLVAISGLHLGLVAVGAGFVGRRLVLVMPTRRLDQHLERQLVFVLVSVSCLAYALAAGFTVPTRRALVMVVVGGWLLLLGRQAPVWRTFLLALAVVLLLDPFSPLDQGFWLSFMAVAVLIAAFASRLGGSGWLAGLLVAQVAVFAGLWPILASFGQSQPLAGLIANLVAIPWLALVVMPVLIAGGLLTALFPPAAQVLLPLLDWLLGALWRGLTWLAEQPFPEMQHSAGELAVAAVLVPFLVLLPFRWFRLVGAILVVAWLALGPVQSQRNDQAVSPEVWVWDVGQGLSVLVRSGRHVLLYDTGPAVPGVFSAVQSTLLPNLEAMGIRRIDTLVISHADNDHAGGLEELAAKIPVGQVIAGEVAEVEGRLPGLLVQPCRTGRASLGDLEVEFWQASGPVEGNDASCVVRIFHPASATEWLLPGDISEDIERLFLQGMAERSVVGPRPINRILVAPHHGSKTSSSEPWVETIRPHWVIYTAGYRHRYGHPHPTVTARYRAKGASAINTACSGGLRMTIEANRLVIKEMRHQAPFWIGSPGLAREQCRIP